MNYIDICTPLLTHVAHLSFSVDDNNYVLDYDAMVYDIERLAHRTREKMERSGLAGRKLAWFALSCWLAEHFADLPRQDRTASLIGALPREAGKMYFETLDRLLEPDEGDNYSPRRLTLVELFAAFLELGYRGGGSNAVALQEIEEFRARCRLALRQSEPAMSEFSLVNAVCPTHISPSVKTALSWFLPLGITIGVYLIYNHVLDGVLQAVLQ